jgi:hypothetical protein
VINFPTDLTIDSCEAFVNGLEEASPSEALYLPSEFNNALFGGVAAAIQAINTWGRLSSSREIVLGGNSEEAQEYKDEVVNRPHKFNAAMLAKKIVLSSTGADIRKDVNIAARGAIESQAGNKHGQQRGALCWFSFVDHSSKGFDKNFYTQSSEGGAIPRQISQIENIIKSMVEKSIGVLGAAQKLSSYDMQHLGRIFFELFLNTHEHGSRGHSRDVWLRPGQRVIYSNGISLFDKALEKRTQRERGLSTYLQTHRVDEVEKTRFIEISIIDSGLGFFERWCADKNESAPEDDLGYEYSIIKKCFSARQTSSGKDNKGLGLPVVMDRLTKLNGFMKVRSGRLSLYRNFIAQPYAPGDSCDFSDWVTGLPANESLTQLGWVSGVAITFLIPLEPKQ